MQMDMLPPCSSMHLVNCWVASAQLPPQVCCCWAGAALAWGAGAAASLELPPKRDEMPLPMTCPIEEPMATPL